jgi:hypothetical protein
MHNVDGCVSADVFAGSHTHTHATWMDVLV